MYRSYLEFYVKRGDLRSGYFPNHEFFFYNEFKLHYIIINHVIIYMNNNLTPTGL